MIDLIYAATVAFIVCLLTGPILINWFTRLEFGQTIREVGPKAHYKKAGTPTMGGIIIILAVLISTLVFVDLSIEIIIALFVTLGYGFLGLLDDVINIIAKRSEGLTPRQKLLGQIIIATILAIAALVKLDIGTELLIPYYEGTIDLGIFFIPFVVAVVVGTSNAVNLTDGLDGLAAG